MSMQQCLRPQISLKLLSESGHVKDRQVKALVSHIQLEKTDAFIPIQEGYSRDPVFSGNKTQTNPSFSSSDYGKD